jgi:hypothetical protein
MTTRRWFGLLVLLAGVPLAYSKGPPDLILISGGGLAQPVEITEPSALKAFNPWLGQFADWQQEAVAEAPCFRRSFEVLFYMKWPGRISSLDRGDLKMIYATRYCSTGLIGYVYLPGPRETSYGENTGTIIRGDADGKWHPATAAWDTLIGNAVAAKDPQSPPDMILISGGELPHSIEVTDPGLLVSLDPWAGPFVDWDRPAAGGRCSWEYEVLYFKRGIEQPTPYDRGDLRMIYGFRYCLDEDGGPGFVHLSGRNDKFGPENIRVVWDGKQAGKWHPSTPAWNAFIQRAVASKKHGGASPGSN